jgi:hypothetical protein
MRHRGGMHCLVASLAAAGSLGEVGMASCSHTSLGGVSKYKTESRFQLYVLKFVFMVGWWVIDGAEYGARGDGHPLLNGSTFVPPHQVAGSSRKLILPCRYNSLREEAEVTPEEMEAYRLKKSRGDDPLEFINKSKDAAAEGGGYDYV